MKSESRKIEKNSIIASVVEAVALSFFVFLYAPLEIYFTNKVEFWFDFPMMIRIDLPLFLISTVLIFGVLLLAHLIHKNVYRALFLAGSVFYFALYMEGTFFSGFLPKTDGRQIDWAALGSHRFISLGIYAFLIAVIVVLIRRTYARSVNYVNYRGYSQRRLCKEAGCGGNEAGRI